MNLKKQFPVPIEVYEWVRNTLLKDLDDNTYRFIVRLIDATIYSLSQDRGPYVYVKPDIYKNIKLRDYGFVELFNKKEADKSDSHPQHFVSVTKHRKPLFHATYYVAKKKPRRFLLMWDFWVGYFIQLKDAFAEDKAITFVNLYTGKPINKKLLFKKECKYKPANKPEIRQALKQIESRPINKRAILNHLKSIDLDSNSYKKYAGDFHGWISIQLRGLAILDTEKEIYSYKPIYRITSSGRVSEIGGGLQSCSREMKQASVEGIENVHNYDLKASQVNGLRHQFKLLGLDTGWLDEYINNSSAKEQLAEKAMLSKEAWKKCLLIVIMGGQTNKTVPIMKGSKDMKESDIYKEIKADIKRRNRSEPSEEEASLVRDSFLEAIDGLRKPLKKWRRSLKKDYWKVGTSYGRKYKGEILIKNYLGISYNIEAYTEGKLAARILQGQEAAFIHTLTTKSKDFGYQVIGNEHDGVLTIGEVPREAIERTKQEIGISEFDLIEKAIV